MINPKKNEEKLSSRKQIEIEIGDVTFVVVKKGLGMYSAISLNPKRTQKLIKEAVFDGLKRRHEIPPVTFKNPVTVEITFQDQFRAYANKFFMSGDERISSTQIKFTADNAKDAYFGFLTRVKLSRARHN